MNQRIEIDWESPEYNVDMGDLFDFSLSWWESVYYPIRRFFVYRCNPAVWYRAVKAFYQRGSRGWAERDTWSIDYYTTRVLREMLMDYQKNTIGWPGSESEWPTFTDYRNTIIEVIWGLDHYMKVMDNEETCSCCDKFCAVTGCPIIRNTFETLYRMWPSLWW